jgi:hypothetical protein
VPCVSEPRLFEVPLEQLQLAAVLQLREEHVLPVVHDAHLHQQTAQRISSGRKK